LEESTATNSSVILSGIRREKEAPDGLDIKDYRPDLENSDRASPSVCSPAWASGIFPLAS